jgi:hypothetical protein
MQVERIGSIDALRQYVNETLCKREQLELGAFPFREKLLVRGDRPCGLMFSVWGPRSLLISAIWETERNLILFYDAVGERFQTTRLEIAPSLA